MDGDTALRSKESMHRSFLKFVNRTERSVAVYWVDYNSSSVLYATMPPASSTIVDTFVTHPWIFKDAVTGERLMVDNKIVFWPERWYPSNVNMHTMTIARKLIAIHLPMRSLRLASMWKIVNCLQTDQVIDQLEMPATLLNEIRTLYEHRLAPDE